MSMVAQQSATKLIEVNDAVVRREGKTILSIGSFTLEEGRSVAILGPNGSGKSTFVDLISRETFPLHREIPPVLFRGKHNRTLEEIKQQIGFVSASMQDQIAVHLDALEVVEGGFFGSLGVPKRFSVSESQRDAAFDVMQELGIADLAEQDMLTLSTGQARRVLVARALVHDPDVLVFDEPCTGLDPNGMYYVRKSMSSVIDAGKSVVLVTHYPEDIVPEIDRIVLIKDGRIIADGTREQLLAPQSLSMLFDLPVTAFED